MFEIFGYSSVALFGQLLVGLINGSFYALLSMGLAIIFGLLRIANFAHGAQYMLGGFFAWFLLNLPVIFPGMGLPSIGYWPALLLAPIIVGVIGAALEFFIIRHVYQLDHAYGLLLTVGLAMVLEALVQLNFGAAGLAYQIPSELAGGQNLGFMFLPNYRIWVVVASIVVCAATWYGVERTRLGSYLRAATENPALVRAFGVNVPLLLTLTYAGGVALAGFAGVMAAPIYSVTASMGHSVVTILFAVVVIGGMGSILGAVVSGFALGILEGLTKVVYPEAASSVVFVFMAIVLLTKPAGLFGKA